MLRWVRSLLRRVRMYRPEPRPADPRHARGRSAEEAAARALERMGYRVRARNLRFRFGELDLVCEHQGVLVFVEVKARTNSDHGHPLEAVTPRKRRRLERLAEAYLQTLLQRPPPACRFDVVAVDLDQRGRPVKVQVVADAFRVDGAPLRRPRRPGWPRP